MTPILFRFHTLTFLLFTSALLPGPTATSQTTTPVVSAVELLRHHVLYVRVDNPIKVAVQGLPADEITVTINNGTVSGSNGEYNLHPATKGKATLTLMHKKNTLRTLTYVVLDPPDVSKAILGDQSIFFAGHGQKFRMTRAELLNSTELKALASGSGSELSFAIVGFTVSAKVKGRILEVRASGNQFTKDQHDLIAKCEPGTNIYIEKVKAKGTDGTVRDLGTMVIVLKEE